MFRSVIQGLPQDFTPFIPIQISPLGFINLWFRPIAIQNSIQVNVRKKMCQHLRDNLLHLASWIIIIYDIPSNHNIQIE